MRWKWILGIAGVLFIALILTVYTIISRYDFNNLKPYVIQTVKEETGRRLTLEGDIKLKIGFTTALVVEKVRFENAPWGSRPDMVKVERIEARVALIPLIFGDIELKRLVLIEPDIILETDKKGNVNLPKKEGAEEKEKTKAKPFFRDIRIERGSLAYKDGKSGKTYAVKLNIFTAKASDFKSPIHLMMRGQLVNEPFEIKGKVGSIEALAHPERPWLVNLSADILGVSCSIEGKVRDLTAQRGIKLSVKAKSKDLTKLEKITGKPLPIKENFEISGIIADTAPRNYTISKMMVSFEESRLDGSVNINLSKKKPYLKAKLSSRELDLRPLLTNIKREEKTQETEAKRKGLLPFQLPSQDMLQRADADIELRADQILLPEASISKFNLNLTLRNGDLICKVSEFKALFAENEIDGSAEIRLLDRRPQLKAELSSKRIDLRPFLQESEREKGKPEKPAGKRKRLFPDEPLPLDALRQADANLKLKAGQLLFPRVAVDDLDLTIALKNGDLSARPIKALVGKGTLIGSVELNSNGKTALLRSDLKVEHLDIGKMLKELEITEAFDGSINIDIDFQGRGSSMAAIMGDSDGHFIVTAKRGRVNVKYVDMIVNDILKGIFDIINPFRKKENYTEINCLVQRFDIKDGIADTTVLVADTKYLALVGDGNINLKNEKINLKFKSLSKGGIGTGGMGKVKVGLGGMIESFKLSGTLADPSISLDKTGSIKTLGKAVGGVALLGPFGIAAVLVSESPGYGKLCVTAMESARTGVKFSKMRKSREKDTKKTGEETKQGTVDKATEEIKKGVEGIGKEVDKLFGK